LFSLAAVRQVGAPREDGFMMFDDIEFTTRLRRRGWELVLLDEPLVRRDHIGSGGASSLSPPWRGYYQSRNHLRTALEHRSVTEVLGWVRREVARCVRAIVGHDQPILRVRLRLLGAWHAVRGKAGRTIEPPPPTGRIDP
jgi:rhamnopyranosyl-N-acetylglucosaminyl-diphospho-decaprenol beta-1,3/1,4-galactofuranosyltransferase